MAKKSAKPNKNQEQVISVTDGKGSHSLKEILSQDMLQKLKGVGKELQAEQEKRAQAEAEKKRKEQEEREKNKSFAELLLEYDKKGGGKYS